MGNGYRVPAEDAFDELRQILTTARDRLRELERPTGTQLTETVKTLQQLVQGILEQTEVNVTGNVTAGGAITSTGNITSTTGFIYSAAGYAFDITYTRRAAWLGNDGRLGWASSSIQQKNLVDDVEMPNPLAILDIADRYYVYKAEVDKRDDPENPAYDPNYRVHLEYGHIAEELHEAGLWQAVAYNDLGQPVGVHDNVIAGFALRAARFIWSEHKSLAARVLALEQG